MRICIVSQSRLEIAGGVESYIKSLSSWLIGQQQDVLLISRGLLNPKTSVNKSKGNNYKVLRLPQPFFVLGLLFSSFLIINKIITENHKKPIDVIHSIDSGYANLSGLIASKILDCPFCYSVHSHRRLLLSYYYKGLIGRLMLNFDTAIEKLTYRNAKEIIAVSPDLKNYVLSLGIAQKRIIMIPVAINVASFNNSEEKKVDVPTEAVTIGYVGRLEIEKNIFMLLTAFKEFVKLQPKAELLIIGDGSYKRYLENYINTSQIPNVHFLGIRHDISDLLKTMDIFILPSFTEGFSIALLEAMAAKKAIAASNITGIQKVVEHGKSALLFDPNDPKELSRLLLLLSKDPELRRELGKNAKTSAIEYDFNVVFPKILQLYDHLKRP